MDDAAVTRGLLEHLARCLGAMDRARESGGDAHALSQEASTHTRENAAFLKEVIEARGWPVPARFGEQAQVAAGWLLTFDAADDPEFQNACLDLMGKAAAEGAVDAEFFAFITDRVLLTQGRAQRYGTQVQRRNGYNVFIEPVEDPAKLNIRRYAIGLDPLNIVLPQHRPAPTTLHQRPPSRTGRGGGRR